MNIAMWLGSHNSAPHPCADKPVKECVYPCGCCLSAHLLLENGIKTPGCDLEHISESE